jgi:uncharacterized protein
MAQCPNCGKPRVTEFRPFCSARCKQVDLNRWFNESYRVPTRSVDEEEDETAGERREDGE